MKTLKFLRSFKVQEKNPSSSLLKLGYHSLPVQTGLVKKTKGCKKVWEKMNEIKERKKFKDPMCSWGIDTGGWNKSHQV